MTTSSADHLGGFSMNRHGMGEIARLFAADSSDLDTWSGPLRARLTRDPAGGWQSADAFGLSGAIAKQRAGLKSAETLLRVVARDLDLMAVTTQRIADHFGDVDGLNATGIEQIRAITRLPEPPNGDTVEAQ